MLFATTEHALKTAHRLTQTFTMTAIMMEELSGRLNVFLWPNLWHPMCQQVIDTHYCKMQIGEAAGEAPWVLPIHLESLWGFTCCSRRENRAFPYWLSVSSVQKIKLQLQSHRGWHLIRFFSCETPETDWHWRYMFFRFSCRIYFSHFKRAYLKKLISV